MTDLDRFFAREYLVEIRRRAGDYYLFIPELGLTASGTNLAEVHHTLEDRQRELYQNHFTVGTADHLPLPRDETRGLQLKPLLFKAAAVALAGIILMVTANVALTYVLREPVRKSVSRLGRTMMAEFTVGLRELHDEVKTPEQEAKIRQALRDAVPVLKPYVDELRPLFEEGR